GTGVDRSRPPEGGGGDRDRPRARDPVRRLRGSGVMDRRLAERRKRVAEDRARSNLSRLIRVLVVLALVAAAVWFAQSPFVSVGRIRVEGADRVDVMSVLDSHGVTEGRPMLVIDVQGAERALRQDPWVAEATVARDWPQTVVVAI